MGTEIIGMLHIPINTILTAPREWRKGLGLPAADPADWMLMNSEQIDLTELSFRPYLEDRMLSEARTYEEHGIHSFMIENIAAPYFSRENNPKVVCAIMNDLAKILRKAYPKKRIGIQILAFADDQAMDIAIKHRLDFIRSETALFKGVRPEGSTPNEGNLAELYYKRSQSGGTTPKVYVDLQKKHTVFADELADLQVWLKNLMFQKLEGVIISGPHTGVAVNEDDLRVAREAIEVFSERADSVGVTWTPELLVGSGVSVENIKLCKSYADSVIVGSAMKENGYWECPLDEERVKAFMHSWRE